MARVRSSLITGLGAAVGGEEFVIVELTKGGPVPVYDGFGQLMKFADGGVASKEALRMTTSGKKFQPRRVKDDSWEQRELARFTDKEYKPLPWFDAVWWKAHSGVWGKHHPHVSQKNSVGLMAYTESDDKGSADVQTPIKPGKYLERYFSNILDPYIIRDLCTTFSNVFEDNCLIFASTEDEFEALYTTGPSSCMSHPKEKYTSHIHPVRVYAAGDLALVYMKRDGRIVARALCWPDKKIYSRVYGDTGRIEPLLQKEGYRKGPPTGAKLQRVLTWENKAQKSGNQAFVAPHIDDISSVTDMGDHLLIGSNTAGKIVKLTGASGVTEWVSVRCKCGKETTASSLVNVYVGSSAQKWCPDCVKTGAFKCTQSGHNVANTDAVEMYDGTKMWRRMFAEGHGFTCVGSGLNFPIGQRMGINSTDGNRVYVSKKWYKEQGGTACKTCGVATVAPCTKECQERYTAKHPDLMGSTASAMYFTATSTVTGRTR